MPGNNDPIKIVNLQLEAWREQMLGRLLPFTAAIGTIGIIVGIISAINRGTRIYIPIYAGIYLLLLFITFVRRLPYRTRAVALLFLIAIMGIVMLAETGLSGEGRSFLLILPIAAMVLLGWRYSLFGLTLSAITFLVFGWLVDNQKLPLPAQAHLGQLVDWVLAAALTAMLATGVIISLRVILQNLITTLQEEQRARQQLHDVSDHLEQKVIIRAQQLERHSTRLAAGAEVSRALSAVRDPDELLQQAASLIQDKLDFEYVGVYILDQARRFGTLQAAADRSGLQLPAKERPPVVGDDSLVGWCLTHSQARIQQDDLGSGSHPLPGEGSIMVLPLRVGGRVIGALELHNARPAAFDGSDITTLQGTADQVAVLIENVRLCQQTQEALDELATANRLLTRQTWQDYDLGESASFAEFHQPDQEAWAPGEVDTLAQAAAADTVITLPLTLRGEEIGHLVVEPLPDQPAWSSTEADILHSVAAQAATALDGARQFEASQRRIFRERAIRDISDQMQRATDMETLMRVTAEELNKVLGASCTYVRMSPGAELASALQVAEIPELPGDKGAGKEPEQGQGT